MVSPTLYFYPRSPCGERLGNINGGVKLTGISIHALLAESDTPSLQTKTVSPSISIHALLAESDGRFQQTSCSTGQFLSTLSLRRATCHSSCGYVRRLISIHALLAESDSALWLVAWHLFSISIHALLAESDTGNCYGAHPHFISIHALLAESDGHRASRDRYKNYFYPRSPCGERHIKPTNVLTLVQFLSTLSLRRATQAVYHVVHGTIYFYPRSPCGERPAALPSSTP